MSEIWLEPPFNMLVSGVTNCGKTYYVLELLKTVYKNKFDYIVIFCPTFIENKTYNQSFIYDDDDIIILIVDGNLNALLLIATEVYKNFNTLFIIDDCANLHDSKMKSSQLTNLAFSGRHLGISTWVIAQKYNSVVKDYRENIRMLVLYYNKDDSALQLALEENNIIEKDKRAEVKKYIRDNKNSKIIMKLEYPYNYIVC